MVKFKFKVKGQFTAFMGLGGGQVFLILPTLFGPPKGVVPGVLPGGGGGYRRGLGRAANGSMGMAGGGAGRLAAQSG
jgi:hypothetical protein